MKLSARYTTHTLRFKFPAGTSRGVLEEKKSFYIIISDGKKQGIGEAGPLPGLSIDDRPDLEEKLQEVCDKVSMEEAPASEENALWLARNICGTEWPSLCFALETALLDWLHGGRRVIFKNSFVSGEQALPINGLIWMGEKKQMQERLEQKLSAGFQCLKMKIGAIHFEEECAILEEVRTHYSADEITIRVDANGAFTPDEAMDKLRRLAQYDLHSIEQPIKAGQPAAMEQLCRLSPVQVALDEELIGIEVEMEGAALLDQIKPSFIILKPSLLGGIASCRQWIQMAEERKIGWWMTSALESDIGLNAISQFTASYPVDKPQGLGTGQLYHNNIPSPLELERGELKYKPGATWDLRQLGL
ncbi:o-succinylbenzoate synthase [Nafulsella turpanensis]|uniref:o-succinylbenzoate synthase n=1 Tax=Nafulsella turpanensis TaxID=1265690 RepID=UPI00034B5D84|nr:o-succinylbenzoate synthase [Nafulsella turpanensis]